MSSKGKTKVKKKPQKWKKNMGTFAVVKFYETLMKLFDCIPDLWFANEEKTLCYWPPKSKKSTTLRAMSQDLPEDDWDTFPCEVVSEGHATYSIAYNIVKEKAAQKYNTSSADEHIQEAKFRRDHPGLIHNGQKCFEDVFEAPKTSQSNGKNEQSNCNIRKTCDDTGITEKANEEPQQSLPVLKDDCNSLLIGSESKTSLSASREDRSGSERNRSKPKRDNNQTRSNHSQLIQSRSQSHSTETNNKNNEYRDVNPVNRITAAHIDSCNRSLTRSRSSSSRSRTSRSRTSGSGSRTSRSRSRVSRPRSRNSRHSQQAKEENHSRKIHSPLRSIISSSKSGSARSRTRSDKSLSRSISRSQGTRSRSRNSRCSQQQRYDHQSRRIRSQTRDRSKPRTRRSHSNNDGSQQNNRSRSRSDNFVSRSQHRENHAVSRSRDSKIGYSHKESNRSPIYKSTSQYSSKRLPSGQEQNDHRWSRPQASTVRKTHPDKSYSNYGFDRSGFGHVSGKCNSNARTNTQQSSYNYNREIRRTTDEQLESRKKDLPVSPNSRNRFRVDEMYRLHQLRRAANSSMAPRSSQTVSSPELQVHRIDQPHHRKPESPELIKSNDANLLQTLLKKVRVIESIVTKNDRRLVENDRRLTRLEVTVNKTFLVLGDVSNAINTRAIMGNTLPSEVKPPKGFRAPQLPIKRLRDLVFVNDHLANKDFLNYLVFCEKEFCCSSSSTDTVTMTSYLRRFIDVDLRASIVLKDLKGQPGMTLYNNFYNVYLFLINTMKAGYLIKNKILTNAEVHIVLRTVWSRSKQTADESHKSR